MNDRSASLSPPHDPPRRRLCRADGAGRVHTVARLRRTQSRHRRRRLQDFAPSAGARIQPVDARQGMVVAQESRAARIGVEFLQKGGNAVDAAVATGFALAVTYPRAGNIGGGGYMVIHLASATVQNRRSTIARPRRPRPRATSSSTTRAKPTRRSHATPRSRSACPARSPASRSRTRNTARGNSPWRT